MTARIVTGHEPAARLLAGTRAEVDRRAGVGLPAPVLAIVMAGSDPGAQAYARRQADYAARAGVEIRLNELASEASAGDAARLFAALDADDAVDGVLPLFPFGPRIDPAWIAQAVAPGKDVDGLHSDNAGRIATGLGGFAPCTARGALALAETLVDGLRGLTVTVVGASLRVGRPLAQLLLRAEATVTVAHAATRDLPAACRGAELLFVAAGRPGLIGAGHVRPGAVVVDIGVNLVDAPGRPGAKAVVGDVDADAVAEVASALTAAPDGVGPLTTAFLMAHTLEAAVKRRPG